MPSITLAAMTFRFCANAGSMNDGSRPYIYLLDSSWILVRCRRTVALGRSLIYFYSLEGDDFPFLPIPAMIRVMAKLDHYDKTPQSEFIFCLLHCLKKDANFPKQDQDCPIHISPLHDVTERYSCERSADFRTNLADLIPSLCELIPSS